MSKSRLEAFSDGVFAIIITIIVLELPIPTTSNWSAILTGSWVWKFMAYVISFLLVASFWVSHHNMINNLRQVTTKFLWLNILTIFPISLIPVTTAWFGEFPTAVAPSVVYAIDYVVIIAMLHLLGRMVFKQIEETGAKVRFSRINATRLYMLIPGIISIVFAFVWPLITAVMIALFTGSWILRAVTTKKK